jgi:energy-coupling factor transport system permease protein
VDRLLYAPEEGFDKAQGILYRLDPRIKVLSVVSLLLYLAIQAAPVGTLLAAAGLHALALGSRGTRTRLAPFWRTIGPLVVTIVLLASLRWRPAQPLWALGPVAVTVPSIWVAVRLGARITALSLGFSLLLWTTEPGDAVAGLTRLGLPFEIGFSVIVALQYVFTFRRLFYQILEAQQSRGLILPRHHPIQAVRTYMPVLIPLLIAALRAADSLALALQSRGFGGGKKRTSRRTLRLHARDWVFLALTWGTLIGLSQV